MTKQQTSGYGSDVQAQALAHIRKESQDLYNRIHSIAEDAAFVDLVHQEYPDFPLIRK